MTSLLEQLAGPKDGLDLPPPGPPIAECRGLLKAPGSARAVRLSHHGVKIGVNGFPAPRRARQFSGPALAWDKREPMCWEDHLKRPEVRLVVPQQKDDKGKEISAEQHIVICDHAATRNPKAKAGDRSGPNRIAERNFLFLFGQSKVLQNSRPSNGDPLQQPQRHQRPADTAPSELPCLSGRAVSQWLPPRPAPPLSAGRKSVLRSGPNSARRCGPCPRVSFDRTLDFTLRTAAAEPPPSRQRSATATSLQTPRCSPRASDTGGDKLFLNFVSPAVPLKKPCGLAKTRSAPSNHLATRQRIIYGNDGMPPWDRRQSAQAPETPGLPCTPETEPDVGSAETEQEVSLPHVRVIYGDKSSVAM